MKTNRRNRKSVGVTTMAFNIQDYLETMRGELNEKIDQGFAEVTTRAAEIAAELTEHKKEDTRVQGEIKNSLQRLGDFHGNMKRFTWTILGAGVVAFIAFLFDMSKNHLHWL